MNVVGQATNNGLGIDDFGILTHFRD